MSVRRVRVGADYGASTPVWMSGLVEDLSTLGVSTDLQERLRTLSRMFEYGVVPEQGWRSDRAWGEYEALLDEVVVALGAELGPKYEVTKEPQPRHS